ncbi:MAG: hypothetical protein HXY34_11695 [Candidatus Thorarchaeota archaeon]|nr:hypothetical protein [Candidatus Thorarchaeota archaeon]
MGVLKELTEGLVSLVRGCSIDLKHLGSTVGLTDGSPVLIVATKSGFLRVIPVASRHIAQIRIAFTLSRFRHSAHSLLSLIRGREMQMVHSTGFCPMHDRCIWEGYFLAGERDKIEELCALVRKMDDVLGVEVTYLSA